MTTEEKANKKVKRMLKCSPYFLTTVLGCKRISKAHVSASDAVQVIIFDCAKTQDGHYSNIFDTIMTYTYTEFLNAYERRLYEQTEAIIGKEYIKKITNGRYFEYFYFDGVPYRKKHCCVIEKLGDKDFKTFCKISGINLLTGKEDVIFDENSNFQPYKTPAMQERFKLCWDKMDILIDMMMPRSQLNTDIEEY